MVKRGILIGIVLGLALLLVPLIALSQWSDDEMDYARFRQENERTSISELKDKGLHYIQEEYADSALASFALVESRLDNRLPRPDFEKALDVLNNTGYIYHYILHDYPQAFSYYNRALDLCQKHDYKELLPCLHLNLGNLYENFEETGKAHEHYKAAIALAIAYDRHDILSITVNNILMDKLRSGFDQTSDSVIMKYRMANISDTVALSHYTKYLVNGCEAMREGNYTEALALFTLARENVDTEYRPRVYEIDAFMAQAISYDHLGNTAKAIECLEQAFKELGGNEDDDVKVDLYSLLRTYYEKIGEPQKAKEAEYNYYRLYHDLYSSRIAAQMHDLQARQQIEAHNAATREMVRKHRTVTTISIIVGLGLLVIIALLWSLYRKGLRQRQLIEDLYQRALEAAKRPSMPLTMTEDHETDKKSEEATSDSPHDPELDTLYRKIEKVFNENSEIYDPGFTLTRLAELLDVHPRRVSQAINDIGGKNFASLLAEQRVKEACRRIADQEKYGKYTIGAIAESVGFQSRTNFSSVFKRVTGLTPSEFQAVSRK